MKRLKSSRRQLPFRVLRRFAPLSKANLLQTFTWYHGRHRAPTPTGSRLRSGVWCGEYACRSLL